MKRVCLAAVIAVLAVLGWVTRSDAAVELCPAAVSKFQPSGEGGASKLATSFAFDLDALSAEVVRGTIAVETDKGWFLLPFGPTAITVRNEAFVSEGAWFRTANYASGALFARFPQPVAILRAFVLRVTTDDAMFPWPTRGEMTCDYMTDGAKHDGTGGWPKRPEIFAPAGQAPQLVANPTGIFANLPCAAPFVTAKVVKPVPPDYPIVAREDGVGGVVLEEVVVDEHGAVVNQWMVSPPSWYFDGTSDQAAHRSTYAPAISFCKPVPSVMDFVSEYRPD